MEEERTNAFKTTQPVERRIDERALTVFRPALIETEEFAGFCLVKNLSPSGMMGIVYAQFAAEQPVAVQFHPDHFISGMIAWSRDGMVGLRFDKRIDVDEMLQKIGSKTVGTLINRAPRLPIESTGEVEVDGRTLPITALDISQRGMKAAAPYLKPDQQVLVRLDGMEPRKAQVRWVQGGMAGLHFISPLGFEELAKWVIELQSR